MASIKVKFRPSASPDSEGSIYYQIIHERKVRLLPSSLKIYPSEWDVKRSSVLIPVNPARMAVTSAVREGIRFETERIARIERRLTDCGLPYSADDIASEFHRQAREYTLFHFMETIVHRLKDNGKIRTSETYRSTLNDFRKFRHNQDIMLDRITADTMESYEAWLRGRGVSLNTVSFYTRILRAVYNRAVERGTIEDRRPFRHVYTGVDKTIKRALPISAMRRIKHLDLAGSPAMDFARDMFMMSFYLRGMSFVDMAYLRETDLHNGYISYRRRKTGQLLIIAWTHEMQSILDKYPRNETNYLLPIIRHSVRNERSTYRNTSYNINHNLKKIGRLLGIPLPLTLYVARHSWASVAKSQGIPLSVISAGMGHDSETTTRIYLASLDTSVVDKANTRIMKSLG